MTDHEKTAQETIDHTTEKAPPTLFIGLADNGGKDGRHHATIYLSNLNPDEVEWDEFEQNRIEVRDKNHRTTRNVEGVLNTHMPSDIAIGVLTNILQAAGIKYTRIDV